MKITLVQPRYFNIWEALGLAYIGAYLKKHSPVPVELEFYQGYFDSDDVILERAADSDIVGFSCTSPVWDAGLALARALKARNPGLRTVFGGWHPSAVPEDCIAEDGVDHVIVGEGELAFVDLVSGARERVLQGSPLPSLDEICPDRELIKTHRTIDLCEQMTGQRITAFQSCRVCQNSCTFCAERTITGRFNRKTNPIRERDPGHLIDEIMETHARYRLDHFKFVDATWNTSPEKVIAFCEEKRRRGLKLSWEANIHATYCTKPMLEAMKGAGCRQINVGCESGSQSILNDMKKGLKLEQIENVFAWARDVGIERRAFFLIGMPNESEEDMHKTEALVERIQPEVFGVTIICPYPGCDLYNSETMRDYDWSKTDEYSNPYWRTKYLTNAELHQWQERLTTRFSHSLAWHNRVLQQQQSEDGARS